MKVTLTHDEIIIGLSRVMREKLGRKDDGEFYDVNPRDCTIDHCERALRSDEPDSIKISFSWEF